jgi:hypothetical protein
MEGTEQFENPKPTFDWIAYYRTNSTRAHQLKQANDHAAANNVFTETLKRIQELKDEGIEDEWINIIASTLHYEILDCIILLQVTPSEVNKNFHQYGEFLKEQIIKFSYLDKRLNGLASIFDEDFSVTDIQSLHQLMIKFESIILITKEGELSPEEKLSLGMIYLFLNKFFEVAFSFFGFSTKMVKECYKCKNLFRSTAERAKQYFDSLEAEFLEKRNFQKYKDYVNKWFGIYSDIIDAKFALYVRNHVDDTNWAFQQNDMDMLWKDIDEYLSAQTQDEAEQQTNENAAINAMEVLLDIYETNALMNITNYEASMKGLNRVLEEAERLKHSEKIVFYVYLKKAIIARKYLLDTEFNRTDFSSQLEYATYPGSRKRGVDPDDTQLAETQYADTQLVGEFSFAEKTSEFNDDKTTNALFDADRAHAIMLPDDVEPELQNIALEFMPTREFRLQKPTKPKYAPIKAMQIWRKRLGQDFKAALKLAQLYNSAEVENENHILRKWLAILQARLLLSEFYEKKFKQPESRPKKESYEDLASSIMAVVEEAVEDAEQEGNEQEQKFNAQLNQIESLLLKYGDRPKVAYFRQLAEIYILLGRINVEKIELMVDKITKKENVDLEKEPYICFDKARDYLCAAYNILQDLEQDEETVKNTALRNELTVAYSRLKFINYTESGAQRRQSTILPSIDEEATEFRKREWIKSFCGILSSDKLADLKNYKEALIFEFESEAKKFLKNINKVNVIGDAATLPEGLVFKGQVAVKNAIAENGMYKTYIKVVGEDNFFLCIESELPISPESLKILSFLTGKILKLFVIHQHREALEKTQDTAEKLQLKIEILKNAHDVIRELLPDNIVKDGEAMHDRFFSKLIDTYNIENFEQIDPEYAKYIALIYDVGMAGIDNYFLNKPTGLLPYEEVKLRMHIQVGLGILKGILGVSEFRDVLMVSMLHHYRESGKGYPEELNEKRSVYSPKNLIVFVENLTIDEIEKIHLGGDLNEREEFLIRALAICDTLKAITAKREYRDEIIKSDEQIQLFLQEHAINDFPADFIEFVKRALCADDSINFIWE